MFVVCLNSRVCEVLREQYPYTWPRGQAVKTSPFHGGNTGSNPVGVMQKLRFRVTGAFLQMGRGGSLPLRGSLLVFCANPASRYSFCFAEVRASHEASEQSSDARNPPPVGGPPYTRYRYLPLRGSLLVTGIIQESSHASRGPLLVFRTLSSVG